MSEDGVSLQEILSVWTAGEHSVGEGTGGALAGLSAAVLTPGWEGSGVNKEEAMSPEQRALA